MSDSEFNLYEDMKVRTKGEIYIGVVGPVRTGKSTFIKRFMDYCVIPSMKDASEVDRTLDEMPQSASGITVTTTEPKFIPGEAQSLFLEANSEIKIRLIDCVGFMIHGAGGHMEGDSERMVKTTWSNEEIPFTKAAEIGTNKVIENHSTVGIVVTSDGSFGEFTREAYLDAEKQTIENLKKIGKPFVVIVNSAHPTSEESKKITEEIIEKYNVNAIPLNCAQLKKEDLECILKNILFEFPVRKMEFTLPVWFEFLNDENELKNTVEKYVSDYIDGIKVMRDIANIPSPADDTQITGCNLIKRELSTGSALIELNLNDRYYYEMLSSLLNQEIEDDYMLMDILSTYSKQKALFDSYENAIHSVLNKGYAVVIPKKEEIKLDSPELVKNGNKYGIKLLAHSPSIHFIKADIETEVSPIVGSEEQARELIDFINKSAKEPEGIWQTNVFGKTIEELIFDGIKSKINMIGDDCQLKLQDTMQKIVNDLNGGMVCIII